MEVMEQLGYGSVYKQNLSKNTGTAIFYRKAKFAVLESHYVQMSEYTDEFMLYCILCPIHRPNFNFVFVETELIDGLNNTELRTQQVNFMAQYMK